MDYVQNKEEEVIDDPRERFLVTVYDFKQSLGMWYSVGALRIFPILLFIIPVNVLVGRANRFLGRYNPDLAASGTVYVAAWVLIMVAFAAVSIISPKAATVLEYVLGFAYLFWVILYHAPATALGWILFVTMILFLIVKTVFLVFEIMRLRLSKGDAENVERDESGRIIQSSKEEVFFNKNDVDDTVVRAADNDFFLVNENSAAQSEPTARVADDDFFIGNADAAQPEPRRSVSDDDFFFVKHNPNDDRVSEADDDFFFG